MAQGFKLFSVHGFPIYGSKVAAQKEENMRKSQWIFNHLGLKVTHITFTHNHWPEPVTQRGWDTQASTTLCVFTGQLALSVLD